MERLAIPIHARIDLNVGLKHEDYDPINREADTENL